MQDTKVIAIANQKGGVGKSNAFIGSYSSKKEKKVCMVDLDPQGNYSI